ncbi:YiiD C-terminal domain-containing protein [Nitrincola alkalisediminis]|uniref:YiiD C-terminal domain-containing protein n=1 Tax=Nitrincola alkalisediminis TaxID=1366656 RepID=UPI001875604E|nr:YiiD C-terminal domain-containing protein [Nitrincola alkalisediminis]
MNNKQVAAFFDEIKAQIPLINAMELQDLLYDGHGLSLHAPLSPNINDKGTGFGGSLAALATLSGWCLTSLYARDANLQAGVVIAESHIRYLAPVTSHFTANVNLPSADVCKAFIRDLRDQGKAKWTLDVDIYDAKGHALSLIGTYVARMPT